MASTRGKMTNARQKRKPTAQASGRTSRLHDAGCCAYAPAEADAAFADWLAARHLDPSRFGPKDVQVVTTHGAGSEQRGYRVYYYDLDQTEPH